MAEFMLRCIFFGGSMAKDINQYLFLYEWKLKLIIPEITNPQNIHIVKQITEVCDPLESIFTEYRVSCLMDNVVVNLLRKKRKNAQIEATLIEHRYIAGQSDLSSDDRGDNIQYGASGSYHDIEEIEIFTDTFIPFFDENSFPSIISDKEFSQEPSSVFDENEPNFTGNLIEASATTVNFTMFHKKSLQVAKRLVNEVYGDCDVATALAHQISLTNIDSVIIDPPDNESLYDKIIIPTYKLNKAIEYLQIQYGIYKKGLLFFIDRNTMYILDRFSDDHDYEKEDFPTSQFMIRDALNSTQNPTQIQIEDDGSFSYSITAEPLRQDNSILSGELEGDTFVFSNFGLGLLSMEYSGSKLKEYKRPIGLFRRETASHSETGQKISLLYDQLNNVYNLSAQIYERCLQTTIGYRLTGVAYNSFKPNKSLTLTFDNDDKQNEFGGKKLMLGYNLVFATTPSTIMNQRMSCSAIVQVADMRDVDAVDDSGVHYDNPQPVPNNSRLKELFDFSPYEPDGNSFVSTKELFIDQTNFPEIEEERGAVRINVADNSPYYTQRDNKRDPFVTCNVTSYAMALHYANNPFPSPNNKQPEDWFDEKIYDKSMDPEWDKFIDENSWAYNLPRREVHGFLAVAANKIFGRNVVKFHGSYTIKGIVFEIVKRRKPVVVSGDYSYCGIPGHISVVTGIVTNQKNIASISNQQQIDLTQIVKFEFNDPFGDPATNYSSQDGELTEMSLARFDSLIKPTNNINGKFAHIFT